MSIESGLEQISNVESHLMHPEYSPTTLENDIALIYVSRFNSISITQVSYAKRYSILHHPYLSTSLPVVIFIVILFPIWPFS